MTHDRDVIALEIHCIHCRAPVTLYVIEWRGRVSIQESSAWTCPLCKQENAARFPGKLEFAILGHDQPD